MPIIQVKYATPNARPDLVKQVADAVARLTNEILHKDRKLISIAIEPVASENWYVGGATLAEQKLASFFLDIKITDGTNTKDEKAAYIAAMFRTMGELLGTLHNETYVHVHDVDGAAYGFGGLTQERRYIAAKLGVSAA